MSNMKKILLPVDFPDTSFRVLHQAAALARRFHSEIVMLHVVTPQSQTAGVPDAGPEFATWDLLAEILKKAPKDLEHTLRTELGSLTIRRMLVKGDPAKIIVRTAQQEKVDLVMMPSYGYAFNQFLLGSETAKVLNATECPVWTDAHVQGLPVQELTIHSVLCAIGFNSHKEKTVCWANEIAAKFGAHLTIAHITSSVELWGPGGSYVVPELKEALLAEASEYITKLKKDTGIDADVYLGSGDVPKVLSEAAKQTKADLLVIGCRPYGGHLRTHGYSIICAVPIPILSVSTILSPRAHKRSLRSLQADAQAPERQCEGRRFDRLALLERCITDRRMKPSRKRRERLEENRCRAGNRKGSSLREAVLDFQHAP